MSKHVHYLEPIAKDSARGRVAEVYAQLERDLGAVPEPFTLHSPAPRVLAGLWTAFRESLIAAGTVSRGTKEAVAAAISDLNRCPWCVDAHSGMLYATGNADLVAAIDNSTMALPMDMQQVLAWARATRTPGADILRNPPFSSDEAPEYIGTAVVFHFLNSMVTVVLSERFLPSNSLIRGALLRIGGWMFAGSARRQYEPGASLSLLPEVSPSGDFDWATPAPHIAGAFARFASVIDEAGARVLTDDVRACVRTHVAGWDGSDPSISRSWVDDAVAGLTEAEQSVARMVLLAALAPHQVDAAVIDDFRAVQPADDALIEALAWGSFAAARRVGSWLRTPA